MKLLPILLLLVAFPAYAGGNHHTPPEPVPVNVPDNDSNHNVLWLGVVIAAGVCIYHRCWEPKPVKAQGSIVPETPKNEYTYTIKP